MHTEINVEPRDLQRVSTALQIHALQMLAYRQEAQRVQGELDAVLRARQETVRLRAALVLSSLVGVGGQTARVTEYDRRLETARERLLRSDRRS